jgi:hypothetical protein
MREGKCPGRDVEMLALRALAGERVSLLLGGRAYTLTVDPVFRVEDGSDGFLYLCSGLESLRHRIVALADGPFGGRGRKVSELGGARGSH